MSCSAFTDTLDPCAAICTEGKDVCVDHIDFYDPDTWFEKYVFSGDRHTYYFSSSSKLQVIYMKGILEARVKITREHFKDLETSEHLEGLVDYYLLCCSAEKDRIDPLWSKKLFTATLRTVLSMHMPDICPIVELNPHLLYRFLDPLFATKTRSFDFMVSYVLFECIRISRAATNKGKGYANLDVAISLLQYINDHPEFNNRILLGHSQHIENLSQIIDLNDLDDPIAKFLASLPEKRQLYRDTRQETNKPLREELSYAVWKPEMYLDHECYAQMMARWQKN